MQFLDLFDAANPGDCYRRTTSIRPQQALAMTNSEIGVQQAQLLASKLESTLADTAVDHQTFINAAFEQVLARRPSEDELSASQAFLEEQLALLSAVESEGAAVSRARAGFVQALFSHHDFVTVR